MAEERESTILVVDDHDDSREMLAAYLALAGYRVVTAQDGIDALERMQHRVPDVVLLDLAMPRMNGIAFLDVLRRDARAARVPVIGVTAQGTLGANEMLEAGAQQVLTKPFDLDELRRAIVGAMQPATN